MPIYEYRCAGCGTRFEELVFGDAKVACPSCAGRRVEKQLSVPARPAAAAVKPSGPACDMGAPPSSCCGGGGCHTH